MKDVLIQIRGQIEDDEFIERVEQKFYEAEILDIDTINITELKSQLHEVK